MARQKTASRPWGLWILGTLVVGGILAGMVYLGVLMHTRMEWGRFQLQLASSIFNMQQEEGYLRAETGDEEARVHPRNAGFVLSMLQTADCTSMGPIHKPVDQVELIFSDGSFGTLSRNRRDRVHVDFTDEAGKRWRFWLGVCNYESLQRLLSVEGAAIANEPWER